MAQAPAVIVFARAPIPGETKTRLIPALGASGAAELYRCFLIDALSRVGDLHADIIVAAAEPEQVEPVRALAAEVSPHAEVMAQSGNDLGQRMNAAFEEAFRRGHSRVVIVGTDLPDLPIDRVQRALALLQGRQLVLGPCLDGGYYLVGLTSPMPGLFEHIEWGGRNVLVDTLRRAQTARLRVSLLEPWYDVDTPDDLEVLRSHLTALYLAGEHIPCPRTWQYLAEQFPEQ